MTDIKHNLSLMMSYDNPIWGAIVQVNEATNGFWIYLLLAAVFIISSYAIISKTNDIGKSLTSSMHIVMVLTVILFYAGKVTNYVLVPELLLLAIIVVESIAIGGIYFMRAEGA